MAHKMRTKHVHLRSKLTVLSVDGIDESDEPRSGQNSVSHYWGPSAPKGVY